MCFLVCAINSVCIGASICACMSVCTCVQAVHVCDYLLVTCITNVYMNANMPASTVLLLYTRLTICIDNQIKVTYILHR